MTRRPGPRTSTTAGCRPATSTPRCSPGSAARSSPRWSPNYISKDEGGTANYNNYSNPQVDELFLATNAELDFAKRTQLFNEPDKLMAEDMHSIPLFQLPDFAAADRGHRAGQLPRVRRRPAVERVRLDKAARSQDPATGITSAQVPAGWR